METHKTVQKSVEKGRLAPGEERILVELKKAQETVDTRDGLKNKELLKTTGLAPSILSQYLYHLQKIALIGRTLEKKYRIKEAGNEVLATREEVIVISRSKRVLGKDLEPGCNIASRILPIGASIYLSTETERLLEETQEEIDTYPTGERVKPPGSKQEAKDELLAEIAAPIADYLDTMFVGKFRSLAYLKRVQGIQQMQPIERREYLRRLYKLKTSARRNEEARKKMENELNWIENQYTRQKLPGGGPLPLTLDALLDFDAAIVVLVSRERLKKDADRIRSRFAAYLLELYSNRNHSTPIRDVEVMAQVGIITDDEFQEYERVRGHQKRLKILKQLQAKYLELASSQSQKHEGFRD